MFATAPSEAAPEREKRPDKQDGDRDDRHDRDHDAGDREPAGAATRIASACARYREPESHEQQDAAQSDQDILPREEAQEEQDQKADRAPESNDRHLIGPCRPLGRGAMRCVLGGAAVRLLRGIEARRWRREVRQRVLQSALSARLANLGVG